MHNKLINIQQKLKAPKNQWNDFSKYKYRNAEDILNALKPLLKEEELTLLLTDKVLNIGNHNYIEATAVLSDGETQITVCAYAREEESLKGQIAAQITGGASSYARKYALNGMFLIDDSQDPDSQDNTQQPAKKATPKQDPLVKAKGDLMKALKSFGHDNDVKIKVAINTVLQKNTVDSVDEANEVMQALEDGLI